MSRSLGSELPGPLRDLLNGRDLGRKVGHTFLLLTVDETGWPRAAMLSAGEVLATAADEVMVALWPDSNSTANLSRTGEATLVAVVAPESYYIRLRAGRPSRIKAGTSEPVMFTCHVEEALSDVVPYAEVTEGIQFRLADGHEAATLERWHANIKALRALKGESSDHAPTAIT